MKENDRRVFWSLSGEVLGLFQGVSGTQWGSASLRKCHAHLPGTRGPQATWQLPLSHLGASPFPMAGGTGNGQETTAEPFAWAGRELGVHASLTESGKSGVPPTFHTALLQRPGAFPVRYPAHPHVTRGRYAPMSTSPPGTGESTAVWIWSSL